MSPGSPTTAPSLTRGDIEWADAADDASVAADIGGVQIWWVVDNDRLNMLSDDEIAQGEEPEYVTLARAFEAKMAKLQTNLQCMARGTRLALASWFVG